VVLNEILNSAVPAPRTAAPANGAAGDEFVAFCDTVRRLCGIDLAQYKRGQMERRVRTFAERRGCASLTDYVARLSADAAELDAFLDRVTINVSQLWRNPDQWDRLERRVIPELLQSTGRLRAWSAGCSYGAEALSLAAVARTAAATAGLRDARIEIDGTDIDKRVVERARRGRFTPDDARDAPSNALKRGFDALPGGEWQARPELLSLCRFEVGDLLRAPARPGRYDLILCRNTVIYFTDEVRDALHARLAESLRPGGYLVVGATERVADTRALGLEPAFPFTYRKS
jgi:chemotaxis protein methyltransferase CheR